MNDVYMSDKEQAQVIKDWLKKYAPSIIIGIALAFGGSYGWRTWQQHRTETSQQASILFEQMRESFVNNQIQQFQLTANELMEDYPKTPYATLAALQLADQAVQQGNLEDALKNLQWVVAYSNKKSLQEIAKMRAARVLLAQNKPQDALKLLQTMDDSAFLPEVALIKGDSYLALGDKTAARNAYQNSLNTLPPNAVIRPLVQMKFDQLAG